MSDRALIKKETPSGKGFEVKEYLTARERNALRNVTVEGLSIEDPAGKPKISNISGELLDKFHAKAIEVAVVSYDGNLEKILERLLDGRSEDYDCVVAEAVKLVDFKPAK